MDLPADETDLGAMVAAWGRQATAFQVLGPALERWVAPHGAGLVGYVHAAHYHVAGGDPVCPGEALAETAQAFVEHAASQRHEALFFAASDELLAALDEAGVPYDALLLGHEPEWDPADYHTRGAERRSLRAQLNRARNKGLTVTEVSAVALADATLRASLEALVADWLESRPMPAMRFLVNVAPFARAELRRYFVAHHRGRPVALLVASPVPAREGWFFEHLVRHREAPNGAVECVVDAAMRALAAEGARYVSLGLAPLAGVDDGPGAHRAVRRVMCWSYRSLGAVYNFAGLERFKARFAPSRWAPRYLVTVGRPITPLTVHAMLAAFSGGHVGFAGESVRRLAVRLPKRAWLAALGAMTLLLVPWTLILSQVDAVRWFGSRAVRTAWVTFDAAMVLALAALVWLVRAGPAEGARRVALLLGALTLGDFVLTVHGALGLDPVPGSVLEWGAVAAACGAPLAATALLVGVARLARL